LLIKLFFRSPFSSGSSSFFDRLSLPVQALFSIAFLFRFKQRRTFVPQCLVATDFTTVNGWTTSGLKTFYLLFVIELKSRRVQYLGSTQNPTEAWVLEAFGSATAEDGLLG
jgi:hypothetical protein